MECKTLVCSTASRSTEDLDSKPDVKKVRGGAAAKKVTIFFFCRIEVSQKNFACCCYCGFSVNLNVVLISVGYKDDQRKQIWQRQCSAAICTEILLKELLISKVDVVFLLTQPPSPPEDPAPSPPTKDKDNVASKKPPTKGKTAAGSQQVAMWQQAALPVQLLCSHAALWWSALEDRSHSRCFCPEARPGLTEVNMFTLLIFWVVN